MDTKTPAQELHYASESISSQLAAGVDSISEFAMRLADVMPSLISGFKGMVGIGKLDELKGLTSDQKTFVRLMGEHSYGELRYIRGYAPEGFIGTFLQALDVLERSVAHCATIDQRVLAPYTSFLANFTNGGQYIRSMNTDELRNQKLKADREELDKEYGSLFTNSKDARVQLGSLIERNGDWADVFRRATNVHDAMQAVDRKNIAAQCRRAEVYLELIEKKIKDGKLKEATPEVCKALADGAEQVAHEVAYVSAVYYRVLEVFNSIDNTVSEVRRVIKA